MTKKYKLDGKIYTILQIVKLKKIERTAVRRILNKGAKSLNEFKVRKYNTNRKAKVEKNTNYKGQKPNWQNSMMNDRLGHWALINKALR